ncbi:SagB family peptide dehydrogenase [Actinophytocola gossypii]|uniref:SagB family peptide dehydrogenase n=1 Tax=Actinophytocola gossypii TaxID=2812003 RepID=A0ABT2J2J3_9PSEU|nr:SagB family peptide dehydrogenase [Actinophytocola gossypii]MCT2581986.1 SagB family peptide dehydrogenase [Actinophytocola gossypii]
MPFEHDEPLHARSHLRSLSEDVLVERPDEQDTRLRVVTRWGEFVFDDVTPGVRVAMERMSMGPNSVANIEPASREERAELRRMLDLLSGSVVHTLRLDDDGGALLSVVPVAEHARFAVADIKPDQPVRLSRFAAIRAGREELVLDSAVAPFQVVLHRALTYRAVFSLGRTTTVAELAGVLRAAPPVVADLVGYLVAAGVVLREPDGADDHSTLAGWSHHDLMFHARTRIGRDLLTPAVSRDGPAPPVTRPLPPGPRFPLYRPESDDLVDSGPSLTRVIETDRLRRIVSDRPLDAKQLGELLYRAARVRSVSAVSPADHSGVSYETSDRPYLSIAGLYELELYVTINRCAELPRGIYHYDPAGHALTLVNDSPADLSALLDNARIAAGRREHPPALITVTARADRLLWLMSGTGYATTLMHLGALQQTLHLVAAAAGLATYPLALDTTDTTERALRLDWPAEVGIGECVVGYRHPLP